MATRGKQYEKQKIGRSSFSAGDLAKAGRVVGSAQTKQDFRPYSFH